MISPCPFCKSNDVEFFEGYALNFVQCNRCFTNGPKKEDAKTAIDFWNLIKKELSVKTVEELKTFVDSPHSNMTSGEAAILNALILLIEKFPAVAPLNQSELEKGEKGGLPAIDEQKELSKEGKKKSPGRPKKEDSASKTPEISEDDF